MKHTLKAWWLCIALFHLPFAIAIEKKEPLARADIETRTKANLGLFLVLHNQLSPSELDTLRGNLNRFLQHLEEVTDRRTVVTVIDEQPGLTDFEYFGNDEEEILHRWLSAATEHANDHNLPLPSQRHKYILVTPEKINFSTHGIATPFFNVGIASLNHSNSLPHEIGHVFGATHEASDGFPCQSIMWPYTTSNIFPCHRFSEANQQAIRDYLKDVP